ncbi:MerR family transcriptional regulator [Halodesulfovibrio sp.]|jgi:DNA-binding transcriptional MerR regulator|uniref:MerR family transcriptional regulator n=1 Tax=Halodesulfovibrio sp. TaxID=1912772 RepID=UPI0025E93F5F|nr:MerR family transcriptional regulator [Halodesulfovibrio sp.]MCT4536065.1 MerR family transcriptional regulator [Halodesulfovibrio sp.]
MNIKDFSELTGISAYTIRYYEKIGLLTNIERKSNGHRHFTQSDVFWVEFITRLKETGMPLKSIIHYAELRQEGDTTNIQRLELLQQHASCLEDRLTAEMLHLQKLKEKIAHYENLLSNSNT